jgi:hypothetical protein
MSAVNFECAEVVGKIVKSLTVYGDGAEMVLEFTDGTSFTTSLECKSSLKANLIRTGIGTPEMIKSYSE